MFEQENENVEMSQMSQSLEPTQKNDEYFAVSNRSFDLKKSTKKKEYEDVLILKKAEGKENIFHKFKERDCRIGKDPNCEINITGEGIEPFHVHISYRCNNFYLRSISAREVTFIKVDSRVSITNVNLSTFEGMEIEMGLNIFKFVIEHDLSLSIKIIEGRNQGEKYYFPTSTSKITIGRKASNLISFPKDTTLSSLHSRISFSGMNWYIEDLWTTNGTWIKSEIERKIHSGMIFKIGTTNFQFSCELRKVKNGNEEEQTVVFVQKESENCGYCQKEVKDMLYLPCSHCFACEKCSKEVEICGTCGQRIASKTKIFRV